MDEATIRKLARDEVRKELERQSMEAFRRSPEGPAATSAED